MPLKYNLFMSCELLLNVFISMDVSEVFFVQDMKACRGSRGIAPLVRNLSIGR